jgi:hypothetical protein
VFRHTDAQGITWNYSKTPFGVSKTRENEAAKKVSAVNSNKSPFGVSRVEKKAAATAPPAESGMDVTVKDLGDRIQFERATPFGTTTWQRNKSELTDAERAMWEREQKKAASTADRAESRP